MAVSERVGLVVGATGGIGEATARLLAARGVRLGLVARREAPLAALADELGAIAVAGDCREPETSRRAVQALIEAHGRLDYAVHAVGSIVLKPLARLREADLLEAFQLNVVSAFHLMQAALPSMVEARDGSVVVCSSVAAAVGLPNHEAIAAAKGALEGLVRSAAMTHAGANVRFNAVAPGLTRTPLAAALTENPTALAASLKVHPLGQVVEPAEVSRAIVYLLESTQVTGTVLPVDGGIAAGRLMR